MGRPSFERIEFGVNVIIHRLGSELVPCHPTASSRPTFVSGLSSKSRHIQLLRSWPSGHDSPWEFLIPAFIPTPRKNTAERSTRWSQIFRMADSTSDFSSSAKDNLQANPGRRGLHLYSTLQIFA